MYRLRQALLLWQIYFTNILKALGFKAIPHEPYYYTKDSILVFFYINDIIIISEYRKKDQAQALIQVIKREYTLTGRDDL